MRKIVLLFIGLLVVGGVWWQLIRDEVPTALSTTDIDPVGGSGPALVTTGPAPRDNAPASRSSPRLLMGRVIDVHGLAIERATVLCLHAGSEVRCSSDYGGHFVLELPMNWDPNVTTATLMHAQYQSLSLSRLWAVGHMEELTLTSIEDGRLYALLEISAEVGAPSFPLEIVVQERYGAQTAIATAVNKPESASTYFQHLVALPWPLCRIMVRDREHGVWLRDDIDATHSTRARPLIIPVALMASGAVYGTVHDRCVATNGAHRVRIAAYSDKTGQATVGSADQLAALGGPVGWMLATRHIMVDVPHGGRASYEIRGLTEGTLNIAVVGERGLPIVEPTKVCVVRDSKIGPVDMTIGGGTTLRLITKLGTDVYPAAVTICPHPVGASDSEPFWQSTWRLTANSEGGIATIPNVASGVWTMQTRLAPSAHIHQIEVVSEALSSNLHSLILALSALSMESQIIRVGAKPMEYVLDLQRGIDLYAQWVNQAPARARGDTSLSWSQLRRELAAHREWFDSVSACARRLQEKLDHLLQLAPDKKWLLTESRLARAIQLADIQLLARIAVGIDAPWH